MIVIPMIVAITAILVADAVDIAWVTILMSVLAGLCCFVASHFDTQRGLSIDVLRHQLKDCQTQMAEQERDIRRLKEARDRGNK